MTDSKIFHLGFLRFVFASIVCINIFGINVINASQTNTSKNLTEVAQKIADMFYALNGEPNNPHKKINHTKGFCASGEFIPNQKVAKDFAIPFLHAKKIEVKARFSLGGGEQSDKSKSRAMALKMQSENSDLWEIAMTNSRVNFAKNADEFMQFLGINLEQKQGQITPQEAAKKRESVPSFVNFAREIGHLGVSPSFADSAYHSVHTFFFTKSSDELVPARFSFVPKNGVKNLSPKELENLNDDFLESSFQKQLKNGAIKFALVLEVARQEDSLEDITSVWAHIDSNGEKISREHITLGELRLDSFSGYECNEEVFMPSILPSGVQPPKDEIFDVRSMVYAITFGRRQ